MHLSNLLKILLLHDSANSRYVGKDGFIETSVEILCEEFARHGEADSSKIVDLIDHIDEQPGRQHLYR